MSNSVRIYLWIARYGPSQERPILTSTASGILEAALQLKLPKSWFTPSSYRISTTPTLYWLSCRRISYDHLSLSRIRRLVSLTEALLTPKNPNSDFTGFQSTQDTLQNPYSCLQLSAGYCTSVPSALHSSPCTWSLRNPKDGQKPRSGVVKKEREDNEGAGVHQLYAPQSWNTLPPAIRTRIDRQEFKMLL